MKVKDLKNIIKDLPDNMNVTINYIIDENITDDSVVYIDKVYSVIFLKNDDKEDPELCLNTFHIDIEKINNIENDNKPTVYNFEEE